ncbi:MAG: hypothetical protein MUC81_09335 [Bacteroidia bacterium]|nr:hypothetical protein [Bacteroidia bacterium]
MSNLFRSNLLVSTLLIFSCTGTQDIEGEWRIMATSSTEIDTTSAFKDLNNKVTNFVMKPATVATITVNSKQIILYNQNGDVLMKENYKIFLTETDYCKMLIGKDTAVFYYQLQPVEFTLGGITYYLKQN